MRLSATRLSATGWNYGNQIPKAAILFNGIAITYNGTTITYNS